MNTLDKEQELIDIFVKALDGVTNQFVDVISARDYTEDRADRMVVVGISNTVLSNPQNPFLPDYDYTVDILVDCFVKGDEQGYFFQEAKNQVLNFLEKYLQDKNLLEELFGEFPVVGLFLNGISNTTTEDSNQTTISLRVVASF